MRRTPGVTAIDIAAAKLRTLIQTGKIKKTLPGERALSQMLTVGRETVRSALELLEKEGIISAAEQKKARSVLASSIKKSTKSVRECVCFLTSSPLHSLAQTTWKELYQLEQALRLENMNLEIIEAPWLEGTTPQKHLSRLVSSVACRAWILHHSSENSQLWFSERNIPCIVFGMSYPGANLPYLDIHWMAVARHAANYLHKRGHNSVGLCVASTQLWGNQLMKEGFLSYQADGWEPVIIKTPIDMALISQNLDDAFKEHPDMTALIVTRGRMLITLQSWIASKKKTVPDDISLLCLTHEHYMDYFSPPLASYRRNTDKISRRLTKMIFNLLDGKKIRNSLVIPELFPGNSVYYLTKS